MIKPIATALLSLTLATSLTGCLAAAAGAGAAGGYYVAKDERPAGQIATDAAITGRVKANLIEDPDVKARNINVDTYYETVTLKGEVPNGAVADKAMRIARTTDGVRGVRSELRIVR